MANNLENENFRYTFTTIRFVNIVLSPPMIENKVYILRLLIMLSPWAKLEKGRIFHFWVQLVNDNWYWRRILLQKKKIEGVIMFKYASIIIQARFLIDYNGAEAKRRSTALYRNYTQNESETTIYRQKLHVFSAKF